MTRENYVDPKLCLFFTALLRKCFYKVGIIKVDVTESKNTAII